MHQDTSISFESYDNAAPNPPSFIGRKALVLGIPQKSKFGGSGAKFGRTLEWDIAKKAISSNGKLFGKILLNTKNDLARILY
jgi:hypothetical protein